MRSRASSDMSLASIGIPEESTSHHLIPQEYVPVYAPEAMILDPHGLSEVRPQRMGQRERLMSQPTPNLSRASSFSDGPKSRANSATAFNMAVLADALEKQIHKEDVPCGHESPPVAFDQKNNRSSFDATGQPSKGGLFSSWQNAVRVWPLRCCYASHTEVENVNSTHVESSKSLQDCASHMLDGPGEESLVVETEINNQLVM